MFQFFVPGVTARNGRQHKKRYADNIDFFDKKRRFNTKHLILNSFIKLVEHLHLVADNTRNVFVQQEATTSFDVFTSPIFGNSLIFLDFSNRWQFFRAARDNMA
jgi:hypothetical protein